MVSSGQNVVAGQRAISGATAAGSAETFMEIGEQKTRCV